MLVNHTNTLLCEDDMSQDGRWQVRVVQCVGASENNSKEFYRPLVIPVSYETPDVEQKQMALLCAEIHRNIRQSREWAAAEHPERLREWEDTQENQGSV